MVSMDGVVASTLSRLATCATAPAKLTAEKRESTQASDSSQYQKASEGENSRLIRQSVINNKRMRRIPGLESHLSQ